MLFHTPVDIAIWNTPADDGYRSAQEQTTTLCCVIQAAPSCPLLLATTRYDLKSWSGLNNHNMMLSASISVSF